MFAGELHSTCSSPAFGYYTALQRAGRKGRGLPDAPSRRTHRQNRAFFIDFMPKNAPFAD